MKKPTPRFPRLHRTVLDVVIACLLTSFAGLILVAARNDNHQVSTSNAAPTVDPSTRAKIAERFGRLPLSFEINRGQVDQPVKFLSYGSGYKLFLTSSEAVLTLYKPSSSNA